MHSALLIWIGISFASAAMLCGEAGGKDTDAVIYTKLLDDGARIVVAESEPVTSPHLALADREQAEPMRVYAWTAVLHRPEGSPLPLWVITLRQLDPDEHRGAGHNYVFDVAVADGAVVTAYSNHGRLVLHRQSLYANTFPGALPRSSEFGVADGLWNMAALPGSMPATPDTVSVALVVNEEGLWTAQISQGRGESSQRTFIEQIEGEWTFRLVRRVSSIRGMNYPPPGD